jgi:hypothetical protein
VALARSWWPRRPSQARRAWPRGGAEQGALAGQLAIEPPPDHDSQDDPDAGGPPSAGHAAHASDRPQETAAEPEPRLVTAVRYRLRLAVAAARQANTQTTIAIIHEAERRGLSSNELLAVAEQGWPQPRLRIRARPGGQRWLVGCVRWVWTHRPRRRAVCLVQQQRQL